MRKDKNIINYLVVLSKKKFLGRYFFKILKLLGVEIPRECDVDKDVIFAHWSNGLVVHPNTHIYTGAKLYQGVTIGRADIYRDCNRKLEIIIDEGAIICAGAKILCKGEKLRVGKNTIIGANAVLFKSTGDNEIWAGNPAKKIKNRIDL